MKYQRFLIAIVRRPFRAVLAKVVRTERRITVVVDEVSLLRQWIEQGAKWPSDVVVKETSKADTSWWSLQPLRFAFHSAKAAKSDAFFAEQKATLTIDEFIIAKLTENGLKLSPQADRRTLIRRLSFDLAAIRKASHQNEVRFTPKMRFTAKLGYFGSSGGHRADVWVFLDGNLIAEYPQLTRDQGLQDIDLELPVDTKFLTLISTDGGNGHGHDQVGFGDAKLVPAEPATLNKEDRLRLVNLRKERITAQKRLSAIAPPPKFFGVVGGKIVPPVHLLVRGDSESPEGEPLEPAALLSLKMLDPSLGTTDTSEGERRAALARWITHPDNPLTPRVIVNRLRMGAQGHAQTPLLDDFMESNQRQSPLITSVPTVIHFRVASCVPAGHVSDGFRGKHDVAADAWQPAIALAGLRRSDLSRTSGKGDAVKNDFDTLFDDKCVQKLNANAWRRWTSNYSGSR